MHRSLMLVITLTACGSEPMAEPSSPGGEDGLMVRRPSGRVHSVNEDIWSCESSFNASLPVNPNVSAACLSSGVNFMTTDLNEDLRVYGFIFLDSADNDCVGTARVFLRAKLAWDLDDRAPAPDPQLGGRIVGPFERWLAGANVHLIFAAAMQIAGRGLIVEGDPLDQRLAQVRDAYQFNIQSNNGARACGGNNKHNNGCIDDHSQGATGYAFVAAYEALSGRSPDPWATQARASMATFFSDGAEGMCVFNPATRRCDGTFADLGPFGNSTTDFEIASFNHQQQNGAYGLGLLTSISSALTALDIAGRLPTQAQMDAWTDAAMYLLDEGQRKAHPWGSDFRSNCLKVAGGELLTNVYCTDADTTRYGYVPEIYPLYWFYQTYFDHTPTSSGMHDRHNRPMGGVYIYGDFNPSLFDLRQPGANPPAHPRRHAGRLAIYGYTGGCWLSDWPTIGGPVPSPPDPPYDPAHFPSDPADS